MTTFKISCVQFTPALEVGYGHFEIPELGFKGDIDLFHPNWNDGQPLCSGHGRWYDSETWHELPFELIERLINPNGLTDWDEHPVAKAVREFYPEIDLLLKGGKR
jgi:hypothetical protein